MAIASYKSDIDPPITNNLPKIEPDNYKSVIYDNKNQPLHALISYVEGAPWTTNYFKQVVSEHNDLREVDPGQASVYQQYENILDLEIRVSSALTSSTDNDSGITTVTGSGLIYPFMIPNVADYFVSDVGQSLKGLFRISQVERRTFNRDSVYYVEYNLVGYIDLLEDLYGDLLSKVIRTYHFSKDRLIEGKQPILKSTEYNNISSLKELYSTLVKQYFKTFFNRRYMTLMIPGQNEAIYDSFLVKYLLKIVDTFDAYEIKLIKDIPTDHHMYLEQLQFWDIMLSRDYNRLKECNKIMKTVSKNCFNNNTFIKGLAFSNIEYIIYPYTVDTSTLIKEKPQQQFLSISEILDTVSYTGSVMDIINNEYIDVNTTYSIIKPVLDDEHYVLSEDFYNETDQLSLLELLVRDYLKGRMLDLSKLLELASRVNQWNRLEQFYYIPIILTLIKTADNQQYT